MTSIPKKYSRRESERLKRVELILDAATRRHESRGGHWRADYPQADDAWRGHLKVARDGGDRRWWFEATAAEEGMAAAE